MAVSDSKIVICTDSLATPQPTWSVWSLSGLIAGRQRGLWNLYEVAFEDLDRGQGKLQRLFPPAGSGRDRREASQLIKTRQQRLLVS